MLIVVVGFRPESPAERCVTTFGLRNDCRTLTVAAMKEPTMRSIFLWLIGIPLPIILLLAFCTHKL